jgi:hypothetical protein
MIIVNNTHGTKNVPGSPLLRGQIPEYPCGADDAQGSSLRQGIAWHLVHSVLEWQSKNQGGGKKGYLAALTFPARERESRPGAGCFFLGN